MKKPKKKKFWLQYIAVGFFAVIGGVCGYFIADFSDRYMGASFVRGMNLFTLVFALLGLCAAFFLHLIIHEAGHLVFGLLSGYRFSSFRILDYMWVKENGKIQFRRFSIQGTSGQCLMSPPELIEGKMPFFLYNLGGAFLNLIVSAVALGLSFLFRDIPVLYLGLCIFSVVGIAIALMNGVPMRTSSVDNDGYNAFSLSRNPEALRAFWIQMKVNEQTAAGIRIKEMPEEWFSIPSDEAMKNSMVAVLGVLACNRMVDSHQFPEADCLMEHLLEIDSGIVGVHRNLMICDRIYIELITKNRKAVLDELYTKELKKFMKAMKIYPSIIRTEYAYALLRKKDMEQAEKCRKFFETCAKTYPYPNDIQSERELMDLAEKAMERIQEEEV